MIKRMVAQCATLVMLLGIAVFAQADPVVTTFQHGHGGWVGGEDAMYNTMSTDVAYVNGSYTEIRTGYNGSADYFTLIAFKDIFGDGVMDASIPVTNAVLKLRTMYALQPYSDVRKLQAYMMTREAVIADHAAPAVDGEASQAYRSYDDNQPEGSKIINYWGDSSQQEAGPVIGVDCASTPVGEFTPSGEGASVWIEIDVTNAVEAWRTGSDNFGLMLYATSNLYAAFWSNETAAGYAYEPQLVVTQDTIPEPCTISMLAIGAAGLFTRRFRK